MTPKSAGCMSGALLAGRWMSRVLLSQNVFVTTPCRCFCRRCKKSQPGRAEPGVPWCAVGDEHAEDHWALASSLNASIFKLYPFMVFTLWMGWTMTPRDVSKGVWKRGPLGGAQLGGGV